MIGLGGKFYKEFFGALVFLYSARLRYLSGCFSLLHFLSAFQGAVEFQPGLLVFVAHAVVHRIIQPTLKLAARYAFVRNLDYVRYVHVLPFAVVCRQELAFELNGIEVRGAVVFKLSASLPGMR